ncbi:MAG: DNA oxidative demethylase AlkB [Caldimonas sp.]
MADPRRTVPQAGTLPLFAEPAAEPGRVERLGPGAFVLHGAALPRVPRLLSALDGVVAEAPFRHWVMPGGLAMSVAMTNCGALGWVSDRRGYRYCAEDPLSGKPWPAMPAAFAELARKTAEAAGYPHFVPDACLVNRYVPGARLTPHQDKDEASFDAPIVSVSLGAPATFLFGGHARSDKAARVPLVHGDVVVWGGPDRLRYHGVQRLEPAEHPLLGATRINLTFRKAG